MPRALRGVLGLLAAVGTVILFQPLPAGIAASPTKDFPLCIQGCNVARAACDDQCVVDCTALFPPPGNAGPRNQCTSACKDVCLLQSDDCKFECQSLKDGESPPEP